jgi:hypothetical protein
MSRLRLSARLLPPVLLLTLGVSGSAFAEALSTTEAGFAVRTMTYTKNKTQNFQQSDDPEKADDDTNKQKEEVLDGPTVCQRISTPSSLGLELGAGGCVQTGGFRTFAHTISANVQLIYYPFTSRSQIDDDASVHMNRQFFGDFFVFGQGGFAKVTHSQSTDTELTYTSDLVEFGGGLGWSYRISKGLAVGAEASYLVGSILSNATSGSSNTITALGLFTVFL